jgi:5'-nucleotidase
MPKTTKKQILLTNDDGIGSPGLWAAAKTLSELGFVTVAAPSDHYSAFGRGWAKNSSGRIEKQTMTVHDQEWEVYAVHGSPSQTVAHAVLEILEHKPDLLVSGINYGENLGTDLTYSGTVMAAFEGAAHGIPAVAVSMQILVEEWDTYHADVDFTTAAYFAREFACMLLEKKMPRDVELLNVVVPVEATPHTPWRITRQAHSRYYDPYVIREGDWDGEARITSHPRVLDSIAHDSDIYTALVDKLVSVTPLSLDFTSRVDLNDLDQLLRTK